ncbi:MAG: type secretory system conjugative transfer family protein [Ilumatobacteraceae bacterium]|nr:type secretory system conjugative transfer family protein [Ilumatobacteraceae bacterium]
MTDKNTSIAGEGTEVVAIAAGAVVIGVGVATWGGARLATVLGGGHVGGGLGDWLPVATRLLRGQSQRAAWGQLAHDLPGAPLYWACTSLALLALIATGVLAYFGWKRVRVDARRRRFGQDTEAHQARQADIAPLIVKDVIPPAGRMLLGRMAGTSSILATEDRTRSAMTRGSTRRQGDRGSVALIGPTGSGKTALVASAIATWDGPVVAVSVKRDLYNTTANARAKRGEIAVFDPGGATGLATARWSPLEAVTTSSGALRTGRALAQAIPRGGVSNADYWTKHGEKLLSAFMAVAGLARLLTDDDDKPIRVSMEQIATWVTTMAGASDPTINTLINRGLDKKETEIKLMARHAAVTFIGIGREDHKIRSSIYSTASLALDPWLEPSVAHSATDSARPAYDATFEWSTKPRFINLDWLMAGEDGRANTLYLAASQPEFERLSPVLGGVLADLKDAIHADDIARKPLEKPLLFVIDEAGQLELGWLPAEVSTIAALGAFFVTCWQSLSQMQHRYGTLSDAVLSGHRTKCFFAGVDDLATTGYLATLLGTEHVKTRGTSREIPTIWGNQRSAGRTVSEAETSEGFAPANALRQMFPGEAVLLHGTLPPIHLDAVRWWKEAGLRDLIPLDDKGQPEVDPSQPTCPLTDQPADRTTEVVDESTIEAAREQLPQPIATSRPAESKTSQAPSRSTREIEGQLNLLTNSDADTHEATNAPPAATPSASSASKGARTRCSRCNKPLGINEAHVDRSEGKSVTICADNCEQAADDHVSGTVDSPC